MAWQNYFLIAIQGEYSREGRSYQGRGWLRRSIGRTACGRRSENCICIPRKDEDRRNSPTYVACYVSVVEKVPGLGLPGCEDLRRQATGRQKRNRIVKENISRRGMGVTRTSRNATCNSSAGSWNRSTVACCDDRLRKGVSSGLHVKFANRGRTHRVHFHMRSIASM